MNRILLAALLLSVATSAAGQCLPSVSSLQSTAVKTWAATADPNRVISAIDAALNVPASEIAMPTRLDGGRNEGLLFTIASPGVAYRWLLLEALRKREPFETIVEPKGVEITVAATQLGAPDLVKVMVERGGTPVDPIESSLRSVPKVTRIGVPFDSHEGMLTYPCSAFLPGAEVVVTGIPSAGSNIVRRFGGDELMRISMAVTAPAPVASGPRTTSCERPPTIGLLDWGKMTPTQRATACIPVDHDIRAESCRRPSTIGLLDWNSMNAAGRAAACAP